MDLWYLRTVLRLVIRERRWTERFESLLAANLAEHEQVAALDCDLNEYRAISGRLLLLAGGRSPSSVTTPLDLLRRTVDSAEMDTLDGLDHLAPDQKAPQVVARPVITFMTGITSR